MNRPPRASQSEPTIVYVGGDPSLDLVNTVDWLSGGQGNERLTSYERLTRWAEGAGVLERQDASALRLRAATQPTRARVALARTRSLRSLLQRVFGEVVGGGLSEATCDELDGWLAEALGQLGVEVGPHSHEDSPAARWRWRGADERLESPLWPVVWSAAQLLTSGEAQKIRFCAGLDCGWVYVDRSRNGLRRWCQMKTCGTEAKTRRRRNRRAEALRSVTRVGGDSAGSPGGGTQAAP